MQTQELLDRCEYTIKYQMQEIDRLRAELERRDDELTRLLEWVNGDSDALTVLQRTYLDRGEAGRRRLWTPKGRSQDIGAVHWPRLLVLFPSWL